MLRRPSVDGRPARSGPFARRHGSVERRGLQGGNRRLHELFDRLTRIGAVGLATRAASDQLSLENARTDALKAARDDISGVSTEEELQRLAQFQHASQAATRFVATVNSLLDDLINRL